MRNYNASERRHFSNPEAFVNELLPLSAPLLAKMSTSLCNHEPPQGSCSWYHGSWQYLRIINAISSPTWHGRFYEQAVAEAFARYNMAPDILISGAADYSILAYIVYAIESKEKDDAAITVVDQCETPLFACRWFANEVGIEITTKRSDIRESSFGERRFDLICSDAFLSRFEDADTGSVLLEWRRLLKSNGRVVTTTRIAAPADETKRQEVMVRDFTKRVLELWAAHPARGVLPLDELERRASAYLLNIKSRAFSSVNELTERLQDWFEVEDLEEADIPNEIHPSRYVRLIMKANST